MKHLPRASRLSVGIAAFCAFIGLSLFQEASPAADDPPVAAKNDATNNQEKKATRKDGDPQKGEPVLSVEASAADAPLCRQPDDPWIELVDLRRGSNSSYFINYRIAAGRPDRFSVIIKGPQGRLTAAVGSQFVTGNYYAFGGQPIRYPTVREIDQMGTFEIEVPSVGERAEVWMEQSAAPSSMPTQAPTPPMGPPTQLRTTGRKISHSKTLGSVGVMTFAREWTEAEVKSDEIEKLRNASPPPPPAGFAVIEPETQPLLPGMPILAVDLGAWREAELLGAGPVTIAARWTSGPGHQRQVHPRSRCAVSAAVLKNGLSRPGSFSPPMPVFPTTGVPLPEGHELLSSSVTLVPGLPLMSSSSTSVTFAWTSRDGKLVTRNDRQPATKITGALSDFAIKIEDRQRLSEPDAATAFRRRLETMLELADREVELRDEADELRRRIQNPDNPAELVVPDPLPEGLVRLNPNVLIPDGLPVLGRSNRQLRAGIVTGDSMSGRVDVAWKGRHYPPESRAPRSELFISEEADRELRDPDNSRESDEKVPFEFVIETTGANSNLKEILVEEFAMKPEEVAGFARGPGRLQASIELTRANARTAQYRLLAAGSNVTVQAKATNPAP